MIEAARIGSALYGVPKSCRRWVVTEFADFSGRLAPGQFQDAILRRWIAILLLIVIAVCIAIYNALSEPHSKAVGYFFAFAIYGPAALFALLCVRPVIRRFHDLNLSAWSAIAYIWAIVVAGALLQRIPMVTYSKYSDDGAGGSSHFSISYPQNLQDWPLFGLCMIPMLFIFLLIFWGGTKGPNRYGPQPE